MCVHMCVCVDVLCVCTYVYMCVMCVYVLHIVCICVCACMYMCVYPFHVCVHVCASVCMFVSLAISSRRSETINLGHRWRSCLPLKSDWRERGTVALREVNAQGYHLGVESSSKQSPL